MQSNMIHASQPMHQQDMVPDVWDDKRVLAQQQQQQQHQHGQQCKHQCERRSPRRHLITALALLFSLTTLSVVLLFFGDWSSGGWAELGAEGAGSWFIKRATGDTSEDSPFIKNKRRSLISITPVYKLIRMAAVWLIVLIVGLFLVLIAGVMLSAWCCKGAFENPLCCPCYLCACCGGLGTSSLLVPCFCTTILTRYSILFSMLGMYQLWHMCWYCR